MAFGAMLLILLSSAVRARVLRRAQEALADEADEEAVGDTAGVRGRPAARRLSAYSWAVGAGFGMLSAAVALGVWVAVAAGALFYGLVICLACLMAMAAAWPRRRAFAAALGGDEADNET
jgi:hypothetical protein